MLVDGVNLNVESSFCYLGDMLSSGGGCDQAIKARYCVAWGKFRKLLPILTSKHLLELLEEKCIPPMNVQPCYMVVKLGHQMCQIFNAFVEMIVL